MIDPKLLGSLRPGNITGNIITYGPAPAGHIRDRRWDNFEVPDGCIEAVRSEIATMTPIICEMAKETGPTDLTPFVLIALAVIKAFEASGAKPPPV